MISLNEINIESALEKGHSFLYMHLSVSRSRRSPLRAQVSAEAGEVT